MKTAEKVMRALEDAGITHATGVPCSFLKGLFQLLEQPRTNDAPHRIEYLPATREDNALAVASGIAVGGGRPVVLMQNSGLGNSLNVLTSLNLVYRIPVLLIVSWRGGDAADAVEHAVIGRVLPDLLELMEIPHVVLDEAEPEASVRRCLRQQSAASQPTVLVVRRGI